MRSPESSDAGLQPVSITVRPAPAAAEPSGRQAGRHRTPSRGTGRATLGPARTLSVGATLVLGLAVAGNLSGCGGGGGDDTGEGGAGTNATNDSATDGASAGATSPGDASAATGGDPTLGTGELAVAPADVPVPASNAPVAIPDGVELDPESANLLEARRVAATAEPDSIAARTRYALALQAAQLEEPAVRTWEQVVAASPDDGAAWYFLALCRKLIGQDDAAMAAIHRSIEHDAAYLPARARRGFWHLDRGDARAASIDFSAVLEVERGNQAASIGMARVLIDAGRDEEATGVLAPLRRTAPRDQFVRFLYGGALQRLGRREAARFELEAGAGSQMSWAGRDPRLLAVANQRVGPRARIAMGQQLVQAGRFADARDRVAPLVSDPATDAASRVILAEALQGLGERQRAISLLAEGVEARPDDAGLLVNLATHQYEAGDAEAAMRLVRQALVANETLPEAHLLLATMMRDAGQHRDAEVSAARAVALDPTDYRANLTLGIAIYDQGTRQRDALAQLQVARQRNPERWEAWYYIAVLLADDGQPDQAIRFAERAALLAPPNDQLVPDLLQALRR